MKTLVVYFSRKGYVKAIAQERAKELGADLCEIKTPERTGGFLGFWWCGRFGMHRWGMDIEKLDVDVKQYEKVVVCSPIWVFTVCAPIRTFLSQNKGVFKSADYILVHFSFPMKYKKTLAIMDELLGVKHERFTSIACQLGHRTRTREM